MILTKTRANNSMRKIFIKDYKAKHLILMKKDHSIKGNIITKYIDHKPKNTGDSCKSIRMSGLHCFNSSTEC